MKIMVDMVLIAGAMPPLPGKIVFKLTQSRCQKASPKRAFGSQL
jgi:hypothetical protein